MLAGLARDIKVEGETRGRVGGILEDVRAGGLDAVFRLTRELDGVALGSAPGDFKAQPGLHKLRLTREGFDDWARTINVYDGQALRVAMQMSADGYAKWKDTTDFLATLDANRKLTDAEVNRINGVAEYFKNSHYRVDTKENIHINKSLY